MLDREPIHVISSLHECYDTCSRFCNFPFFDGLCLGGDTPMKLDIRRVFTPRPGCLFLRSDYSQLEVRIIAHYSRDPVLIAALLSGADIHSSVAKEVFNLACAVEDVELLYKEFRTAAKAIVFGLNYGMTAIGLAAKLRISQKQAQEYIDAFFARFPGIKTYFNYCQEYIVKNSFIPTVLGRKRRFVRTDNRAMRQGVNYPIQSTASEVTKAAMVEVFTQLKGREHQARVLMQIHDELLTEVVIAHIPEIKKIIKDSMELGLSKFGVDFIVPLKTDPAIDYSWGYALKKAQPDEFAALTNLRAAFDSFDVTKANAACKSYYNVFFREIKIKYDPGDKIRTLPGNDLAVVPNEHVPGSPHEFRHGEMLYMLDLFKADKNFDIYRTKYLTAGFDANRPFQ